MVHELVVIMIVEEKPAYGCFGEKLLSLPGDIYDHGALGQQLIKIETIGS